MYESYLLCALDGGHTDCKNMRSMINMRSMTNIRNMINIKFDANMTSGSWDDACGRIDMTKLIGAFSYLLKKRLKREMKLVREI